MFVNSTRSSASRLATPAREGVNRCKTQILFCLSTKSSCFLVALTIDIFHFRLQIFRKNLRLQKTLPADLDRRRNFDAM